MGAAGQSWPCDHADMSLHGNRVQLGRGYFSPSFERINAKARRRKECKHLAHPLTHIGVQASAPRQTFPLGLMVHKKQFNLKLGNPGENRFPGEGILPKHWRVWQGGDTITFVPSVA